MGQNDEPFSTKANVERDKEYQTVVSLFDEPADVAVFVVAKGGAKSVEGKKLLNALVTKPASQGS